MPSEKRNFGDMGEFYAQMFLVKHGFNVLQRNYLKKVGEIDIVAENHGVIHFVEVKSVTRETFEDNLKGHSAEENVDNRKMRRIEKTAMIFLLENGLENSHYQIDLITVTFVGGVGEPAIKYISNANL